MPFRSRIEELQRLSAVIRHRLEVGDAVADEIQQLVERLSRVDDREVEGLVLGRAVKVTAYDDPGLDDSGQVWIPALSFREGLGAVLVDLHEFSYLRALEVPLESATKNQFLCYEECTVKMRFAVLEQAEALIDRSLAILLLDQS